MIFRGSNSRNRGSFGGCGLSYNFLKESSLASSESRFFLFRCGWAQKDKNQTCVLAIWLKKSAFERYLAQAVPSSYNSSRFPSKADYDKFVEDSKQATGSKGFVRMQWDPDHHPSGAKHPSRRDIQLGLKNVKSFVSGEDILHIEGSFLFIFILVLSLILILLLNLILSDITAFVLEQRANFTSGDLNKLITPQETLYELSPELHKLIIGSSDDQAADEDGNGEGEKE